MKFKAFLDNLFPQKIKLLKLTKGCHYILKFQVARTSEKEIIRFVEECAKSDIWIHPIATQDVDSISL